MRITGGVLSGRIIKCPDGVIRPAMDRMRESLFAILGDLSTKFANALTVEVNIYLRPVKLNIDLTASLVA